jgi:hypothetical protein
MGGKPLLFLFSRIQILFMLLHFGQSEAIKSSKESLFCVNRQGDDPVPVTQKRGQRITSLQMLKVIGQIYTHIRMCCSNSNRSSSYIQTTAAAAKGNRCLLCPDHSHSKQSSQHRVVACIACSKPTYALYKLRADFCGASYVCAPRFSTLRGPTRPTTLSSNL